VIAVGVSDDRGPDGPSPELLVVKVDGETGAEVWRRTGGAFSGYDVVADHDLNPIVAVRNDFTIRKLSGETGDLLWTTTIKRSPGAYLDEVSAVALDPVGDVLATGKTEDPGADGLSTQFTVAKLAGETGAKIWHRVLRGSETIESSGVTITADPLGNAIVGGYMGETTGIGLFVAKIAALDGPFYGVGPRMGPRSVRRRGILRLGSQLNDAPRRSRGHLADDLVQGVLDDANGPGEEQRHSVQLAYHPLAPRMSYPLGSSGS